MREILLTEEMAMTSFMKGESIQRGLPKDGTMEVMGMTPFMAEMQTTSSAATKTI